MASDAPFTLTRLREGFAIGAVMEVDIRRYANGGFVCLHDATLDRETTGTGPVSAASLDQLRQLRMRGRDGASRTEPLLLLRDLADFAEPSHVDVRLQLDLKDRSPVIDLAAAAEFGREIERCIDRLVLSGDDWNAVKLLSASAPGIRLGFDPCDLPEVDRLSTPEDFAAFVDLTVSVAPEAAIVYVEHRILLSALNAGFDMVAAFHAGGREVDAWTMKIDQPDLARDLQRLVNIGVDQITTSEPIAFETLWRGMTMRSPQDY